MEANYGTRKHDYWTDSSYFELRSSSFNGKNFGKKQFLDLDTSASNTTELDPYKFTHFLLEVVRSMGSFGFQIWLERRSSRVSVFYFRSRTLQFGASVDVGRENFLASGPWIHQPMIHDGTELKKLIPAWGA